MTPSHIRNREYGFSRTSHSHSQLRTVDSRPDDKLYLRTYDDGSHDITALVRGDELTVVTPDIIERGVDEGELRLQELGAKTSTLRAMRDAHGKGLSELQDLLCDISKDIPAYLKDSVHPHGE